MVEAPVLIDTITVGTVRVHTDRTSVLTVLCTRNCVPRDIQVYAYSVEWISKRSLRFGDGTLRILESVLVSKDVESLLEIRSSLKDFMRSESLAVLKEIAEKTVQQKLSILEFFVRAFALAGDSCLALRYEALVMRELKSANHQWLQVSYEEWLTFAEHSLDNGFYSIAVKVYFSCCNFKKQISGCENALSCLQSNNLADHKPHIYSEYTLVAEKIKKLKDVAVASSASHSVQAQTAEYLNEKTIQESKKHSSYSTDTQCLSSSMFRNGIKMRNMRKLLEHQGLEYHFLDVGTAVLNTKEATGVGMGLTSNRKTRTPLGVSEPNSGVTGIIVSDLADQAELKIVIRSLTGLDPDDKDNDMELPCTKGQEVVLDMDSNIENVEQKEVEHDMNTCADVVDQTKLYFPNTSLDQKPCVGMEFESIELAYDHYNAYARISGFSVRKDSSRYGLEKKYEVRHESNLKKAYMMSFIETRQSIQCICKKFEFERIVCKHMFCVLKLEHISKLPPHYIMKRWTKDAKTGFAGYDHDIQESFKKTMSMRYTNLMYWANKIASSGAIYERTHDMVENLLKKELLESEKINKEKEAHRANKQEVSGVEDVDISDSVDIMHQSMKST
ncbi:hypothetical protein HHK36_016123 [Tetracentron sinense]|uniref:SWIM-type domain-containing protein n=1 Tax=Tetracentron sinense TaxID=13715 RepID=A0A834Z0U1_TETSI|nr:hypothetical protein HHK36_016123 [Tetracentron sinense]